MAVPKRRTSRSNTRARKAGWLRASTPDLVPVTTADGDRIKVPRRLVRAYQQGILP